MLSVSDWAIIMIDPGGLLLVVPDDLYALPVSVLWVSCKTINNQTWMWKIFLQGHILWASPPQNCKQLLYCRIEYRLMVTVPTHKRHYSPFKTLKDHLCFYIWMSNSHCPNPYLVGFFVKGLKWPLQNGHQYRSAAGYSAILLQDLMKRGVCGCGVDMLSAPLELL